MAGSAVASVRTIDSIVAMFGCIIPTPLQMPVTVTSTVPPPAAGRVTVVVAALVVVSVVRRASAACPSASSVAARPPATTLAMAAVTRSTGSRVPMIPVERWSTWSSGAPTADATAVPIRAWSASPSGPVAAFALPEVEITARAYPAAASPPPVAWRFARDSRTGAAANRLGVNTAAAGTGPSSATISTRSGRPDALIPAVAPAAAEARRDAGHPARPRGNVAGSGLERRVGGERHGASGSWSQARRLGQAVDHVEGLDRLAGGPLDEVVEHADGEDAAVPLVEAAPDAGLVRAERRASSRARPRTTVTNGSSP